MALPRKLFTEDILEAVDHWDGSYEAPADENKRVVGVQVFKATWFEKVFATSHHLLPGVWFLPVVAACIYLGLKDPTAHVGAFAGVFIGGVLAWSLLEYVLHRFYFHLVPSESFDSKFQLFMVHGYHHQFPNDPLRLVAPPVLSWTLAVPIALIYYLALGDGYLGLGAFGGTVVGYLAYDWVHFYTHHARPTSSVGKYLRRYHMEHHYKDSDSHFGISSPLWDYVFGTVHPKATQPHSDPA